MTRAMCRQLEPHCVTALLTLLPYNSLKSYCAKTKLNLFFIYGYADWNKCSQQQVCNKSIYIFDITVVYVT